MSKVQDIQEEAAKIYKKDLVNQRKMTVNRS